LTEKLQKEKYNEENFCIIGAFNVGSNFRAVRRSENKQQQFGDKHERRAASSDHAKSDPLQSSQSSGSRRQQRSQRSCRQTNLP